MSGVGRVGSVVLGVALSAPSGAADEVTLLTPGAVIEREIQPGEMHRYRVELREGDYFRADIDQLSVETTATVTDPGGSAVLVTDGPAAESGPRPIALLAAVSGPHEVAVRVAEGFKLPGRYQLRAEAPRPPGDADRLRVRAVQETNEAIRLLQTAKPDAQEALDQLSLAQDDWDTLGDRRMRMWLEYEIGFVLMQFLGRLEEGAASFERSLETAREIGDQFAEAFALRNLAENQRRRGRLDAARVSSERALALYRTAGSKLGVGDSLVVVAAIAIDSGNLQSALDLQHEALRAYRELRYTAGESDAHLGIGASYFRLGEYDLAIGQYRLALQGSADDPIRQGYLMGQIGNAQYSKGDLRKARRSFEEARVRFRQIGSRSRVASMLARLGQVDRDEGRLDAAQAALEEAAAVFHEVGDPLAESTSRCQLGETHRLRGDGEAARRALDAALALVPEGQAWQRLCVEEGLARLARDGGDLGGARRHAERAIGIYESLRASVASPDSRALTLASSQPLYELLIDVRMRQHVVEPAAGHDVAAFEASERARARSLLELLAQGSRGRQRSIEPALVAEQRVLYGRLRPLWEAEEQALRESRTGASEAAGREIASLTTQLRDVEARMQTWSPHHAQAQPLSLDGIRAQVLDADTLLLEYAMGETASEVWVVSKDGLAHHRLARRDEIERAARRVYELVSAIPVASRSGASREATGAAWRAASGELSRLVLPPDLNRRGATRLLIVAPGALQYVPFSLLPMPVASGEASAPLLARYEIVNAPSASVLARLRQERGGRAPASRSVAIFADPVFEPSDPRLRPASRLRARAKPPAAPAPLDRALRGVRAAALTRLPFSRQEADAIAAVAPPGTSLRAFGFGANRSMATSSDLAAYRIVHFATHGIVNARQPELSGVVLSLLDRQGRKEDGFLRLHDIEDLHLGAELVVLSACQTGLGRDLRGEGFVGLTRAFMHAGSPRVVASLWQVDDLATAELMKRFYRGLFEAKLTPAAALRAAQRELAGTRRWSAPYYWAGFVLHGEWR